jgi:hypothetical protein
MAKTQGGGRISFDQSGDAPMRKALPEKMFVDPGQSRLTVLRD